MIVHLIKRVAKKGQMSDIFQKRSDLFSCVDREGIEKVVEQVNQEIDKLAECLNLSCQIKKKIC